jgi:dihydropyrimidinase
MSSWLIRGGTLVSPETGDAVVDLRVDDGRISAIGTNLPVDGCEVYDAGGKHVFPGFIDPHVHLANFNRFDDDCESETVSAAAGGVTTIINFIKVLRHRPTQTSYHEVFEEVVADIDRLSSVDVALHFVLSTYEHVEEIPSYARLGVTSYKFYLGYRGNEAAIKRGAVGIEDGVVYAAFREIARIPGSVACTHAENEELVHFFERSIPDKANASFLDWANSRPNITEEEAVRRACYYGMRTGATVYIVHLSSKEGLAAAEEYRRISGAPIYVETCPHYLMLNKHQGNKLLGATAKVIPPLREQESVDALWDGIAASTVDTVGTDHLRAHSGREDQRVGWRSGLSRHGDHGTARRGRGASPWSYRCRAWLRFARSTRPASLACSRGRGRCGSAPTRT